MTTEEYQIACKETQTPECEGLNYLTLGLASEAGEVAGKTKKNIRGDYKSWSKFENDMLYELGDCMWYISNIADYFGFTLENVMEYNVKKLKARQQNGTIKGSGDDR